MCVRRSQSHHCWLQVKPDEDLDLELRDAIQHLALEFPRYGWLRMTRESLNRYTWLGRPGRTRKCLSTAVVESGGR